MSIVKRGICLRLKIFILKQFDFELIDKSDKYLI